MAAKRFRRPKLKNGELRVYWGKLPRDSADVIIAWQGDPSMKRDANFLFYSLCNEHPDVQAIHLFSKMKPSVVKELEARGYDITTLKFSIMKKSEAQP